MKIRKWDISVEFSWLFDFRRGTHYISGYFNPEVGVLVTFYKSKVADINNISIYVDLLLFEIDIQIVKHGLIMVADE